MRLFATIVAIGCLVICVALIIMWGRSNRHADRLHGRLWDRESFLISSKQGTVSFLWFRSHGHENWWQWETRTYDADDEMSFPVGDVEQYQGLFGFGYLQNPFYYVMRPVQNGWHVLGAASTTLRGSGLIVPYWFLLSIFATLGGLITLRRNQRFGLRTLILSTTVTVLLMGLATWAFR